MMAMGESWRRTAPGVFHAGGLPAVGRIQDDAALRAPLWKNTGFATPLSPRPHPPIGSNGSGRGGEGGAVRATPLAHVCAEKCIC